MSLILTARLRASPKMPRRLRAFSKISPAMCNWAAASAIAQTVERWFDLGVARLVIGTAALKDPRVCQGYGARI